jgi:hypothetical protein
MLKYLYPPFHLLVITYFYNKLETSTITCKVHKKNYKLWLQSIRSVFPSLKTSGVITSKLRRLSISFILSYQLKLSVHMHLKSPLIYQGYGP